MCKKTSPPSSNGKSSKKSSSSTVMGIIVNLATAVYTVGFVNFRIVEIVSLIRGFPAQALTTLVALPVISKATTKLPWSLIAILSMAAVVWITDDYVLDPIIPSPQQDIVVVITGANSGVGFETAKALAQYDASSSTVTVVMACRSVQKCQAAAENIRNSQETTTNNNNNVIIPMQLDLASFDSVYQFVDSIQETIGDRPVNVLFNNAGYVPGKVETANAYGLDPSFTTMHLSHHLLAELLVEQNPRLRLVTTSSATHHICAATAWPILGFFMTNRPGCIDSDYLAKNIYSAVNEDKYIVAKVANVLHASEFSIQHTESISVAIDLGWVGTSIQPWMSGKVTPTSLGWMRSASIGIYPMLQAILQPSFDQQEQRNWSQQGGVTMDPLGKTNEPFSFPWWSGDASPEKMKQVGKELWTTSTEILQKHGCTVCQ
eukprot:CAMPEP_0113624310 /NCGR_PEP_ID=MMETSP0017_2-20120614/12528_1 /TAXON_ID=2856 /ORGANISM="Cylindrotheca closterium" /LENGTH=431 /DNA_ID=CAMNT_0000534329 /DNA_START=8 /DNA_END=1303 /DNA_ORIENTATION=+ /assembly_acc=CAM_ASM_000147